ncbi:MAG: rhodanese-like domain-containing protein [Candidatus Eisenbacteria bacterium]|uniref:Rhodanese-like domain-containing protein n=1 Tax=Eiseniibacteriota bacterium TaxID=2212470 RepID=A0A538SYH2_UNCEI|nr:MAG: rhodanese-like domain-containing protein [Candidatus Eisenbacteria bacterium]
MIRGRALAPDAVRGRRADFSVLDVREEAAFREGHIAGSGHVPRSELRLRRSELPPREQPLLVVAADGPEAAAAAAELNALGFASVAWLDAPLAALEGGLADQSPAARLWRPAPFLEEMLPRIPRPRPDACAALDAAAGAGREAVYLALQGFQVEARDRDPEALARAAALAARHGVRITTAVTDLEDDAITLPPDRFQLVVCFRYLHRPLFRQLERTLAPGGFLVYETYRLGQEKLGRPRRERFLLRPGELASAFPSLIVEHYAELEPAGGPVTARLLARKPG